MNGEQAPVEDSCDLCKREKTRRKVEYEDNAFWVTWRRSHPREPLITTKEHGMMSLEEKCYVAGFIDGKWGSGHYLQWGVTKEGHEFCYFELEG